MAAAPVELWSTRLSCPQLHRRISSLPQQLPSATLGEPENPSLNSDPGCIKVVDTYRLARYPRQRSVDEGAGRLPQFGPLEGCRQPPLEPGKLAFPRQQRTRT